MGRMTFSTVLLLAFVWKGLYLAVSRKLALIIYLAPLSESTSHTANFLVLLVLDLKFILILNFIIY